MSLEEWRRKLLIAAVGKTVLLEWKGVELDGP